MTGLCYAIGDIHGHLGKLIWAHDRIAADKARIGAPEAPIVHIGDYVDRGPQSAQVLDHLLRRASDGAPDILLLGNHDRMMRLWMQPGSLPDPAMPHLDWLQPNMGGRETLASYGVDTAMSWDRMQAEASAKVPQAHLEFLWSLPVWHRHGDCFFCHAGVRPGVALDDQVEDDLVWIRDPFLYDLSDHGALVVHGHTPEAEHPVFPGNRLNIDSRAAYGGPVTAVAIEGRRVWRLTDEGRQEIVPPQSRKAAAEGTRP